jgi:regulator of protease activity HflC (stomatin/prohibitin superfamily)
MDLWLIIGLLVAIAAGSAFLARHFRAKLTDLVSTLSSLPSAPTSPAVPVGPPAAPPPGAPTGTTPPAASSPDPVDVEAPITVHRWAYFASLAAAVALIWFFGSFFTDLTLTLGVEWNVGYIIWVLGLCFLLTQIRFVGPEDMLGIEVVGFPTIVVSGGPVIILPGLHELHLFPRSTIEMELPDEPENIFRNEDVEIVPPGLVPPVRITFTLAPRDDANFNPNDPLNERITAEVPTFVRWRIRNFWDFYVRINTLTEARRQLADMVIARLQERLSQLTVAQALQQQEVINNELDNLVRKKTVNWGIELIDVRIKLIGFSHDLNRSIGGMAQAAANKRSTILEAEGTEQQLTLEGQGRANAVRTEIEARADGQKKMAQELGVTGASILAAETTRAIGESPSTKIVVGTAGIKELVGIGAAVTEAFTSTPTPPPVPNPTPTTPST